MGCPQRHGLGLAGPLGGSDRSDWNVVWQADHVPGSWLWEWQDRAVADKSPVKLWDFDPETGINLVKVKGIVGAYRDVRPDYYAVKVAYAPVKVDLKPNVIDGTSS